MARSYGSDCSLLLKKETSYGAAPTGNYLRVPFVSSALGSEQGLIKSDVLGNGRDPVTPLRDAIKVEGDVVVPVDLRNIGIWLLGLLGTPVDHVRYQPVRW
jgi:hypothetical protein